MDWFQIGKGVCQGCLLSPCLFKLYAEYIIRNAILDETQAGIMIARRNINNLRHAEDTTLMADSKEEVKSLLMKVKEESEKAGLKLSFQKTKIMASGSITSWQIDVETMETVIDFIFFDSRITAGGEYNHQIKMLALWKKSYDMPRQHIKNQRHYLLTVVLIVKAVVFSSSHIWMWKLNHKESWAPKNWCFWTVVLEKTLESHLHRKKIKPVNLKGNQSWIFIGRTDAEAPILWPPDVKNWLIGKDPDARTDSRQEERGQYRMRWLDGITNSMDVIGASSGSLWWTVKPSVLQSMGSQRVGYGPTELMFFWTY